MGHTESEDFPAFFVARILEPGPLNPLTILPFLHHVENPVLSMDMGRKWWHLDKRRTKSEGPGLSPPVPRVDGTRYGPVDGDSQVSRAEVRSEKKSPQARERTVPPACQPVTSWLHLLVLQGRHDVAERVTPDPSKRQHAVAL
jgi:hypothetical protein